jgi:AcrR family transcriptional regulator
MERIIVTEQELSLRERKKRETRQRILDVAIELFQSQGFDQTPVDAIATQANISRGTFFNYFPNKKSLLREIASQELEQLQKLAEDDRTNSPIAKIRHVIHRLVADTLPYLRITRYIFLGAMLYPTEEKAPNIQLGSILGGLVQEAQDRSEICADLPPAEIVHAITGAYLAVFFEHIAHGEPTTDAVSTVERIIDMILEGIAGPNYTRPNSNTKKARQCFSKCSPT